MNKKEIKALFLSVVTSLSFMFCGIKYIIDKKDKENNNQEEIIIENIFPEVNPIKFSDTPFKDETITGTILQENNATLDRIIDSTSNYDNQGNIIFNCDNFGYVNVENCFTYDGFQDGKNINGYLDMYQKVLRVKSNGIYDYVITSYGDGVFVESKNVSVIENTYIEVDISDQMLYFYQDNILTLTSPVVSGMSNTPTRNGYFYIYHKETDTVLIGINDDYEQPVKFWMPFDGGIGFHDASYRDVFGGNIYLINGSHGCVNLPYEVAAYLYENTWTNYHNDGTKVLVHD